MTERYNWLGYLFIVVIVGLFILVGVLESA